jgi:Halocarboxylic acid dehydrogenase DehI
MSDPVPAITESAATGEIAEIFADIRQVYRVGVVNLIWRHLATFPQALPWVWQSVRPLYVDGTIEREAAVLRASIAVPEFPVFPASVIAAAGLGEHDLNQIRTILAAYDRTNAMALIALSAVDCKIAGMPVDGDGASASGSELPFAPPPELRLPPLLSLSELSPATAELVLTMNRIGAKRDDAILASMYRHLAHWPAYLALAWTMLAPLAAGTLLDGLIAHAIAQARASARRMIARLPPPPSTLTPALRDDVARALDRFAGDVIPKMVVIGAILLRTTTAKSSAE